MRVLIETEFVNVSREIDGNGRKRKADGSEIRGICEEEREETEEVAWIDAALLAQDSVCCGGRWGV